MKKQAIRIFLSMGAVAVMSLSCKHNGVASYFEEENADTLLRATVLIPDTAGIGYGYYRFVEDRIVMYSFNPRDDYQFYVYRQKGDSLFYENKFMTRGNGPYEMTIPRFKYNASGKKWILYSLQSHEKEYYEIDLSDFNSIYNIRNWVKKEFPAIDSRTCMEFLNDSVYVNVCYNGTDNLFSLSYAGKDNYYKPLDFPYPTRMQDLHPMLRSRIYTGILQKHPNYPTFVYSCENSKLILIFDIENEEIKNIRYLSSRYPEYTVTKNNPYQPYYFNDNIQIGCYVVDVTDKYIYIGYNTMTLKDIRTDKKFKGYPDYYFDRINVFDWEGNFVKRLALDKPVAYFSIAPDGNHLYAFSENSDNGEEIYRTLRFDL